MKRVYWLNRMYEEALRGVFTILRESEIADMSEFFEVLGIKEKSEKLKKLHLKEKELLRNGKDGTGLSREYEKLDSDILGYAGKPGPGQPVERLDDDGIDMDKDAEYEHLPLNDQESDIKAIEFASSLIDYEDLNTG